VRDACVSIFDARDAHAWPPTLVAPASWPAAYSMLAEENATRVAGDIDGAVESIQEFISEIDRAGD
jgi:hypothetical protein